MTDSTDLLDLPSNAVARLQHLRGQPKFQAAPDESYTGVLDEQQRQHAEAVLNGLISDIENGLLAHPTRRFVLDKFASALDRFQLIDTEDKEAACGYLEEIMDAVGLASSDGLLNGWLYGFDPTPAR